MGEMIENLRGEHRVIIGAIIRARELSLSSVEGRNALMEFRDELMGHLKKEDDIVYNRLRGAAREDAKLMELLNGFEADEASVTREASAFLQKVDTEDNPLALAREFGVFVSLLRDRLMREEDTIFPEYEKRFEA